MRWPANGSRNENQKERNRQGRLLLTWKTGSSRDLGEPSSPLLDTQMISSNLCGQVAYSEVVLESWSPCSCLHALLLHPPPLPAPHLSLLPSPNPFGHNPALSRAGRPHHSLSSTQSLGVRQGKAHGVAEATGTGWVLTKHTGEPILFALGVQQPRFLRKR